MNLACAIGTFSPCRRGLLDTLGEMNMSKPHSTGALSGAKSEPVRGLFIDGNSGEAFGIYAAYDDKDVGDIQ